MLNSTKIKYFTIIGTLGIISTSYLLHAKTFYTELYEDKQESNTSYMEINKYSEDSTKIVNLKPSKIIEKEPLNTLAKVEILKTPKKVIKSQPIEAVEIIKIPTIIDEKPEPIEVVEVKIPTSVAKAVVKVDSTRSLVGFKQYLYLNSDGDISLKTKIALDKIAPLMKKSKNYYIEVEGYSAYNHDSVLSQELSQKYAQVVADYLKSLKLDKKIIVIGHSDSYPIIEDKNDIRNSRIELKFRKDID